MYKIRFFPSWRSKYLNLAEDQFSHLAELGKKKRPDIPGQERVKIIRDQLGRVLVLNIFVR